MKVTTTIKANKQKTRHTLANFSLSIWVSMDLQDIWPLLYKKMKTDCTSSQPQIFH